MEERNEIKTMLELMLHPAFLTEDGVISYVNRAAAGYFLEVGQSIGPMISSGAEEYAEFRSGCLYLTLSLGGQPIGASVKAMENTHIFTLEESMEVPQLQALALAAMELREPLNGIASLTDRMLPEIAGQSDTIRLQASQLNRRLCQLQRIILNMSDGASYASRKNAPTECVEVCSLIEEILEKAAELEKQAGICLEYTLPCERIFTAADSGKLERAIYNLLSNAFKYSREGDTVQAKLIEKNKRLYFSVINPSHEPLPQGNLYNRFLRSPGLEDPRNGIGLGMLLVRSTAAMHGGAVLIDQTEDSTRVTLTMRIQQIPSDTVRSPVLQIDYAGERDHGLIELSDVLPAHCYETEKMH